MKPGTAVLLRIYCNAGDRHEHRPVYAEMVRLARELGLAGATVYGGEVGYGEHRSVHDVMSEYSFQDAPIVVEVVESRERVERFVEMVRGLRHKGVRLVSVVEPVEVVYSSDHPERGSGVGDGD
jgi:PII-like signaling protein